MFSEVKFSVAMDQASWDTSCMGWGGVGSMEVRCRQGEVGGMYTLCGEGGMYNAVASAFNLQAITTEVWEVHMRSVSSLTFGFIRGSRRGTARTMATNSGRSRWPARPKAQAVLAKSYVC